MRFVSTSLALLAIPALAAPLMEGGIAFAPEAGSSLTKTFRTTVEMEIESFEMLVNGEDQSGAMGGEDPSGKGMTMEEELVVEDTYEAIEGGRPTNLLRSYTSFESEESGDFPSDGEEDSLSDMEGNTVRFEWDADEEGYRRSYEGEEGDEDLLAELEVDLDLLALVPRLEAEEGDTWTVLITDLGTLLSPGRDIESGMDEGGLDELPEELTEGLLGSFEEVEVICTFSEAVQRDDKNLGVIELELDFEEILDLEDAILAMMEQQEGMPEGLEIGIDVSDLSVSMRGNGTLTWNLDARRLESLTFEVLVNVELDLAAGVEMGGQVVADIEGSAVANMTLTREVEVE